MFVSWFLLETSCDYTTVFSCFQIGIKNIILNIATLLIISFILMIVINRLWIANLIMCSFTLVIAVINYYTIMLHGMPFSIMDIKNISTALNVIDSYKISIDAQLGVIVGLFCVNICLCVCCKKVEKKIEYRKTVLIRNLLYLVICFGIIYFGYFSSSPIKPKKTIGWSWVEAYHQYGYVACSVEKIYQSFNVIDKPEGYSDAKVNRINVKEGETDKKGGEVLEDTDIIFVLNESFYDLTQITDIKTDVSYLENVNEMTNTIRGYTVVPSPGGGTNSSEYEFLTSNSLQLMKGITPFNVLNMKNANSIVTHLNQLGYNTLGAHSEPGLNYSRIQAYPELGFKEVYFDEKFKNKEYYGKRWYETDQSLYRNLIEWYENMPDDAPKFMYLLTIQNHGGWDMNDPDEDIVHALNNYGEYQEEINEFLTCIKLSDNAFKELTDYFKKVNKRVIVCMVGDHSPSFASNIVDEKYTDEEKKLRLRSTPFVIWSNFDMESKNIGYISMNYLAPTVLATAGVRLSSYYQYMLDLKERVPVMTSYDKYIDATGKEYSYGTEMKYKDEIDNYFYLEYNNLQKNRIQKIFEPYTH